jgi:hypothetical protein
MIPDRVSEEIRKMLKKDLKHIMDREINIDYPITEI